MDRFMTRPVSQRLPPRVLIVGSEDVHARIDLMRELGESFTVAAAGTARSLSTLFAQHGMPYYYYPMARRIAPFSDLRALRHWRV